VMLKLAGGAQGARDKLSVEEFLKQADDYEDMGTNLLDALYAFNMTLEQTHPFPALRAREIMRWSNSDEYQRILRGEYPIVDSAAGGRRRESGAPFFTILFYHLCPECGARL